MTRKLFFFNHGVGGNGHSAFFDSARSTLESKGAKTVAPSYPNPDDPDFALWCDLFHSELASNWSGEDIILVGHSLGGFFTLRLLGEFAGEEWTKKLVGVVLVAPTATKRPNRRRIYSEEIKWENIVKLDFRLTLLFSLDDDHISKEHPDYVIEKLGGMKGFKYVEMNGFLHFIMKEAKPVMDELLTYL